MSRAIKPIYAMAFLIIVLLLNGCFLHPVLGSGYIVDIKVLEDITIEDKDIAQLQQIAKTEKFISKQTPSPDKRECLYFGNDLEASKFRHLNYRFIVLGYCYDKGKSSDTDKVLGNLRVLIYNDWEGQDSVLKQEIDRLGDVFYGELAAKFGRANVKIERRRTGPPF